MPTWLAIVLGVFVALVLILAVGGAIARKRQLERTQGRFDEHLAQVNRDLAAAHAQDRGWARETLEAAAAGRLGVRARPDAPADSPHPRADRRPPGHRGRQGRLRGRRRGAKVERLTLGRRDGDWVNEGIA